MNSLGLLREEIKKCTACDLCKNNPPNTMPVPGFGPQNAKIMLVGMCPGINEIYQEQPFIGRSGKLLRKGLTDQGINPDRCYITNVAKCVSRKGNKNVDPSKKNQKICSTQWLQKEIQLIQPKAIMPLGRIPLDVVFRFHLDECLGKKGLTLKHIIEEEFRIGPMSVDGIQVIPNYHPSYIMQHGKDKYNVFIRQIQLAKEIVQRQENYYEKNV